MKSSVQRALGVLCLCSAIVLSACGGDTGGCTIDIDCSSGKVCKGGACVAPGQCAPGVLSCSDSSQCGAQNICSSGCCTPVSGCATSTDCTDASLPHCNATSHVCEKCASSTQCPSSKVCSSAGRCEAGCAADTDCKVAGKTRCTTGGFCGECKASADCTDAARPICGSGVCFGCGSNADCGGATPVCNPSSKACVVCLDAQNSGGVNPACTGPAKPLCDGNSVCIGCNTTAQCDGGKVCDAGTKTCRTPALASFASSASTLTPSATATLTATLDVATPSGVDVTVSITSGGGSLAAPKITIAAGATSGTVVYTAPGAVDTVALKASFGGVDKTVNLVVSAAPVALDSLTPAAASVLVGATTTLTATLTAQATTSTVIGLVSSAPGTATVPASVTIAAGASTASVTVTGVAANASSATITASYGGVDKTANVTVTAAASSFMVIRVDGGGAALAATAAAVFVEERKFSDGSLVRSVAMPTTVAATGNTALVLTGNSGTEGGLSRSANGKYVTLGGYSMAVGTATPNTTTGTVATRVAGRIDAAGNIDTTTRFGTTQFSAGTIRGVTSSTGAEFWASGSNSGVVYTTLGGTAPVALNTAPPINNRHINIFGGNLYVSQATGVFQGISAVGTGLPTAATTITLLSGFPTASATTISPATFAMLDTDNNGTMDTLYLAHEAVPAVADTLAVEKWTLSGTTWSKSAMVPKLPTGAGASGAIGVTVLVDGGVTRVVATSFESASTVPNRIVTFIDDGSASPAATVLITSASTAGSAVAAFRGLALSPTP